LSIRTDKKGGPFFPDRPSAFLQYVFAKHRKENAFGKARRKQLGAFALCRDRFYAAASPKQERAAQDRRRRRGNEHYRHAYPFHPFSSFPQNQSRAFWQRRGMMLMFIRYF
jgi:hypothetical protein